jgi:proteasome accessory factor B
MTEYIFDPKSFNKIFRQLYIIGLLKEKAMTKGDVLGELLDFYGVESDISERTIERDLSDILKFWGIEVDKKKEKNTKGKKHFINFDKNDKEYKNIIEVMLTYVFKDNLIKHSIDPILNKIENPFKFFAELFKAISNNLHITFDYYFENKNNTKKDMDLEPYDLVHRNGKWLLLGTSDKNPDSIVKHYYIHNMKNLKINYSLNPFKRKIHLYNRDEYYKYAWDFFVSDKPVDIKVWFSKKVSGRVKNTFYDPIVNITDTKDGIIADIKAYSYIEVVNWVLGFGNDAVILKPEDCVDYIKNMLINTLNNYK